MKIAILDRCSNAIGGRPLKAFDFAECFFTLGHDVDIYFNERVVSELRLYAVQNNRAWGWDKRTVKFIEEIHDRYDLFLVNNSWTSVPPNVPVVCNWIDALVMPHAQEVYDRKAVAKPWDTFLDLTEIWLQSHTQRDLLVTPEVTHPNYVIRPPKNYEIFQKSSKPWSERHWDLISVTSDEKSKNIRAFFEVAKEFERPLLILPRFKDYHNVPENVTVLFNPVRSIIAEHLGNSKVFIHLPLCEVCPNVVYEALNSGCHVVTNKNGSMPEQIGDYGTLVETTEECVEAVKKVLETGWDEQLSLRQGALFDRKVVMPEIRQRLDQICQRIALSSPPQNHDT